MTKVGISVAAAVLALAARVSAAELPTAEQVLEKVRAAYSSMTSFEEDIRATDETSFSSSSGSAHFAMEKSEKDGKMVEKTSFAGKFATKERNREETVVEIRSVSDGTVVWTEERRSGRPEVRVRKRDAKKSLAWPALTLIWDLTRDRKEFHLKVVGEETVEGEKMYVLEGAYNPTMLNEQVTELKRKTWVRQDDFIICRQVQTRQAAGQGKPTVTVVEFANVKVNRPVDPALFVYAPPEGAKVDDRTTPKPEEEK